MEKGVKKQMTKHTIVIEKGKLQVMTEFGHPREETVERISELLKFWLEELSEVYSPHQKRDTFKREY